MQDSEKGMFDYVIVYKLDRFSRNRYDSAIYKNKLKKNGVKVLSAMESISDNPEGIILESVLEGMAEYYSVELSQKIRRGLRENALQAKTTNGNAPLGLRIGPDKRFVIHDDEAELVRRVFHFYADGLPTTEISQIMNELGYKTSRGAQWNKNSIRHMLKNEKYIGVYRYMDIVIPDGIPAIIDKNLFERVQYRMHTNKQKPRLTTTKYLLTGKLFCGDCDSNMVGESGTVPSRVFRKLVETAKGRWFSLSSDQRQIPDSPSVSCSYTSLNPTVYLQHAATWHIPASTQSCRQGMFQLPVSGGVSLG